MHTNKFKLAAIGVHVATDSPPTSQPVSACSLCLPQIFPLFAVLRQASPGRRPLCLLAGARVSITLRLWSDY